MLAVTGVMFATVSCGGDARSRDSTAARPSLAAPAPARAELTGAGATFPYPLYSRWIASYAAATGRRANYLSVGSGEGARLLAANETDFAATENPAADTSGSAVIIVPMVAGAIAISYNLPSLTHPLRLSRTAIADLWLGRITRWDDARIRATNAGVTLPALPVTVVSREGESGTTFVVTTFLSAVSRAWAARVGVGGRVRWPVGQLAHGTEGVSGAVKQTPGAVGFVELVYAQQNRLPAAAILNVAGEFVLPSAASTAAALESATSSEPKTPELVVSLVDAPGRRSYPLVTLSWLVMRADATPARREAVGRFVRFALTDGARDAAALNFAPLPRALTLPALARLGVDSAELTTGLTTPP